MINNMWTARISHCYVYQLMIPPTLRTHQTQDVVVDHADAIESGLEQRKQLVGAGVGVGGMAGLQPAGRAGYSHFAAAGDNS